MANADTPFGLRPVRYRNGAPYNGACNAYAVNASAAALFIGDPVVINGTANTAELTGVGAGTFPPGTLPEIVKATAGDANAITGSIVAFAANPPNNTIHNAASTSRIAFVADDPDLVFEIQADSAGSIAATEVGLNAVLIFTHAGSTVTGLSGVELDTTSDPPGADASNQLTIRRYVNKGTNDIGTHALLEVTINNHTYGHAAVGI
jgi:hypothetical protein